MLWGGVPTLFIGIDPSLGYLHSLRPLAPSLVFYAILTPGIILELVIKCSSNILPGPLTIWPLFLLSFSTFFIWATRWALSPAGTVLLLIFQTPKFSFSTNTCKVFHILYSLTPTEPRWPHQHFQSLLFFFRFQSCAASIVFPTQSTISYPQWILPAILYCHWSPQFPLIPLHLPCQSPNLDGF